MLTLLGLSEHTPASLSYVPELLSDELLYSWIERTIRLNVLGYPKECLLQLFGNKNVIPCVDLPTSLLRLFQRLGNNSPCESVTQLLELGTLYSYHRPFITAERDQSIRNMMLHTDGKSLKVQIGRVANRFGANPPLRFCSICVKEDADIFGTPYWKRSHQLPGVSCCLTHQVHLKTHVSQDLIVDRQRYIYPPYHPSQHDSINISTSQLDFAILSKDLLFAGLPSIPQDIRKHIYTDAVIAAGSYSKLKHIDYANLALCIKDYYNNFTGFIHQQRLLSSIKQPLCWLHTLIERPERSSHPICHLLLIGYLFRNIDTFIEKIKFYKRLDSSSNFDCNNEHICKKVHESALIKDTTLSCRQVAKLLNLSTTTIVCKRRQLNIPIQERRKKLNPELINKINMDLSADLALIDVASHNKVSMSTIYRLRAQSARHSKTNFDFDSKICAHRKCWLQLIQDNPATGSTMLRNIAPAAYAWLYRYDKDWLSKTNLRIKPVIVKSVQRIDWIERDFDLTQILHNYVEEIKKLRDRPRISMTLMLRVVGDTMVRRNLYRLPILDNSLQELVESKLEYQFFRIDLAINALSKNLKPLRQSNIQRAASIKNWTSELEVYARQRVNYFNECLSLSNA